METALVTGGAGFLGSHVAERLIERGLRVVVLDDLSGGFRRNVPQRAELRVGSTNDSGLVHELFAGHRFDYVFHLAAYAAEALSHFIRSHNYSVNLLGSINLINAAVNHGTRCFVFTSSVAVYGPAATPFREDIPAAPRDPYGIAKLAVEHDLQAARDMFGLPFVVFRPHNVYGERQNLADPYRNVIGIFMNEILQGRPCTIYGDGLQTRAFSYVDDVAPIIADSIFVPEAHGETFNVGADESRSVIDLARLVQSAMGRDVGVEHLPPRKEAQHQAVDHSKVRRVLGGGEPTAIEAGLRRMARWAESVEIAPPRSARPVEITRHLPPGWAAGDDSKG